MDLPTNNSSVGRTTQPKTPTMAMPMATMAATDLASEYIQQCLGFTSLSSKILSLERIQTSLRQCGVGIGEASSADADADVAAGAREDWRAFLEDGHQSNSNCDDGSRAQDSESIIFSLRDSFIKCLVESCDYPVPGNIDKDIVDGKEDEDDQECNSKADRLVKLSFICLTLLASLVRYYHQHHPISVVGKRNEILTPIFGREFALAIAPAAVAALRLSTNNDEDSDYEEKGPSHSASSLLIELLHPNRPKCEARSSASILRESILVPASTTTTTTPSSYSSVAMVAHVLSSCVIAAVVSKTSSVSFANSNNTTRQQYGEEELSVREETAALGKLQDMRDVLTNVGLACSRLLCSSFSRDEDGEIKDQCAHAILDAIQDMFDIAPFAVGSQLEALLDDEAKPILDRLRKVDEEEVDDVATKVEDQMLNDKLGGHAMDDEGDENECEQAELEETIPPLYASIVRPPILSSTINNLDSMLLTISENLGTTDAELWDLRLDALIDLERILAGGVTYMSEDARYIFIERIRKMPLEEQFTDLRSQITHQVCRVAIAVSYEYRDFVVDDMQLLQAVSQFVECCIPPLLTLSNSGTKLMANQGVNCIRSLFALGGVTGYTRTVPRLCEVVLGKKAAKNQKRACVIALTVALRVWGPNCFMKHLDQLILAAKEGATNRDPTVREEGRKLYWAMVSSCDETKYVVQNMFGDDSREMKNLEKDREIIDAEWDDDGAMSILVQTGVVGAAAEHAKEGITANRTRAPSDKVSVPPRNCAKRPGTRLRAMHGTPFKSQRRSTPMKTASTIVVNSNRKQPPSCSSGTRLSTQSMDASSALKSAAQKSIKKGPIGIPSTAPIESADDTVILFDEEKENSAVIAAFPTASIGYQSTPSKSSQFYENLASPMIGTPMADLLARASPLSAEKVTNTGDFLGEILSMLTDRLAPHDQSRGIKALTHFAKENPGHPSWIEKFPLVLNCLLGKPVQLS